MLKKNNFNFETESCRQCLHKSSCIRASAMAIGERKYFLKLLGYKEKRSKAMVEGMERHLKYFEKEKTIRDIGIVEFLKDVYSGKKVMVKELGFCSKLMGIRGHADLLKIEFKKGVFDIEIIELKPRYNKEYIKQLGAYAVIFLDPDMLIHYPFKTKRTEKILTARFYPSDSFTVNVAGKMIYYRTNKVKTFKFIENNIYIHKMYHAIMKKIKKLRKYHKAGEFYLHRIPLCSPCYKEKCDYWKICQKSPYLKEKQRKLGKRKPVVK